MSKRSQAALEFLTTYGWAFLVVLIGIGGLSSIGVLDPSSFVSESCFISSPFFCERFVFGQDGFSLSVVNMINENLIISSLMFESSEGFIECSDFQPISIRGSSSEVIHCMDLQNQREGFNFLIEYTSQSDTSGAFVRKSTGEIKGVSRSTSAGTNEVELFNDYVPTYEDFVSVWDTTNEGTSNNNQIRLPLQSSGSYDFYVSSPELVGSPVHITSHTQHTLTFNTPGIHEISINGTIEGFRFGNSGDRLKILEIKQWGPLRLGNSGNYFHGTSNLQISARDVLNTTGMTSFAHFFRASGIGYVYNMGLWNTSSVEIANHAFFIATNFNADLSTWDLGNMWNGNHMFNGAQSFNSDLSNWNMSSLTNAPWMLLGTESLNTDISEWDVSNVQNMRAMLASTHFNPDVTNWNVSNVTNMRHLFSNTVNFNRDISGWNVSNVQNMHGMFANSSHFNQDLSGWDVSSVTDYDTFDDLTPSWTLPKPVFN